MSHKRDPLAITATAARLHALHQAEVFDEVTLEMLLAQAAAGPDAEGWRRYLDRLALELGAGLVVAGVIYFFAGNWAALPGLVKIGGVASLLSAAVLWALWVPERMSGRVALTAAGGLIGALLAVYGQVYQTGADAWTLFATWAALLVPWVLASRYEPLLLKWLGITGLAIHLAVNQDALVTQHHELWRCLLPALALALAWFVAEVLPQSHRPARYFSQVVGAATFSCLTLTAVILVFDDPNNAHSIWILTAAGLALTGAWSLGLIAARPFDLFLATVALASAVVILTTALARLFFEGMDLGELGLFILALIVIAQVASSAWWLRARWKADAL